MCVFPFIYNSITYNSCAETKKYDDIGWCAWDSVFNEERWGYCTPNCPNGLLFIIQHLCSFIFIRPIYIYDQFLFPNFFHSLLLVCPRGCQCRPGDKEVDSQGYCNHWCRDDTCGNRFNYWRGIDCGGCNENRDCPDECAARSGGEHNGGKPVVDGYCHHWVNNGWCGVGKIYKTESGAYAYSGSYKAGIDCRGCIGKDLG